MSKTGTLVNKERTEVEPSELRPFVPWTAPFGFMKRFTEEMDRVFEDFGVRRGWLPFTGRLPEFAWAPDVEVLEKDGKLIVRADLPGLTKDEIKLEFAERMLVLHGERKREKEEKGEGFLRSERTYGAFYRAIALPEGVKPETAKASFKDGVLAVTFDLPAREAPKPKTIAIE